MIEASSTRRIVEDGGDDPVFRPLRQPDGPVTAHRKSDDAEFHRAAALGLAQCLEIGGQCPVHGTLPRARPKRFRFSRRRRDLAVKQIRQPGPETRRGERGAVSAEGLRQTPPRVDDENGANRPAVGFKHLHAASLTGGWKFPQLPSDRAGLVPADGAPGPEPAAGLSPPQKVRAKENGGFTDLSAPVAPPYPASANRCLDVFRYPALDWPIYSGASANWSEHAIFRLILAGGGSATREHGAGGKSGIALARIAKVVRPALRKSFFTTLVAVSFAVSAPAIFFPIGNQNTYLLHVLSRYNPDLAAYDWLAGTTPPFPAFNAFFSAGIYVFSSPVVANYALYGAICTMAALCLFRIARTGFRLDRFETLAFSVVLFLLSPLTRTAGAAIGIDLSILSHGFAGHYVFGPELQPSEAGLLFLPAILLFLNRKFGLAATFAVTAAMFHPTYLLPGTIFALICATYSIKDGFGVKHALGILAISLVVLTPSIYDNYMNFYTHDANISSVSKDILLDQRLSHHSMVGNWFSYDDIARIFLIIGAGVIIYSKNRRLFSIFLIWLLLASVGILVLAIFDLSLLRSLMPWRISALLVPLSTAVWVYRGAELLANHGPSFRPALSGAIFAKALPAIIALVLASGPALRLAKTEAAAAQGARSEYADSELRASLDWIRGSYRPGDITYHPPSQFESVRLSLGLPVFVDGKSHPYAPEELIEWRRRLELLDGEQLTCAEMVQRTRGENIRFFLLRRDAGDPVAMLVEECAESGHLELRKSGARIRVYVDPAS